MALRDDTVIASGIFSVSRRGSSRVFSNKRSSPLDKQGREIWEPMSLDAVGHVGDVLQGGGGKLSIQSDDSGDAPRKPQGQE